jgi:hypothetical protein
MTSLVPAPKLAGHGFAVQLPPRWEGRIYRRAVSSAAGSSAAGSSAAGSSAAGSSAAGSSALPRTPGRHPAPLPGTSGWIGERTFPVLHLANFALPASRGDYGSGAVEAMTAGHIFIALLEFGEDCLGSALFEPAGLPRVRAQQFNPNGLQRRIAGQSGFQHFCTENGRPMCLYVVLGSHRQARALAGEVNALLDRIEVAR